MKRILVATLAATGLALGVTSASATIDPAGTVVFLTRADSGGLHSYNASATITRAGRVGAVHRATLSLRRNGLVVVSTQLTLRRRDLSVSGTVSAGCTPRRRGPLVTWRASLAIRGGATILSRPLRSRCG